MKRGLSLIVAMAITTMANADIGACLECAFKEATVEGYIRGGMQSHKVYGDKTYKNDSLGGRLHIETKAQSGISAGATFYTTNKISNRDGEGVPFFNANNESYSILGEAYLKGMFGKTTIKLGRQELDTPFADRDDIGMIPNTFEAGVLINKDIPSTTLILAQVQKYSGVDTDVPAKFSNMNAHKGVQTLGLVYEGIKDLTLQGWYYALADVVSGETPDKITYVEAGYERTINGIGVELGGQYAVQNFAATGEKKGKASGVSLSLGFETAGLTLSGAYNKTSDHGLINAFGGGPFMTSSEHLTIEDMGIGKAINIGIEWDADVLGLKGLTLAVNRLGMKTDETNKKFEEIDYIARYAINDKTSIDAIYSEIDEDTFVNGSDKNSRLFVNYSF
jgi:hypothetical protein